MSVKCEYLENKNKNVVLCVFVKPFILVAIFVIGSLLYFFIFYDEICFVSHMWCLEQMCKSWSTLSVDSCRQASKLSMLPLVISVNQPDTSINSRSPPHLPCCFPHPQIMILYIGNTKNFILNLVFFSFCFTSGTLFLHYNIHAFITIVLKKRWIIKCKSSLNQAAISS